MYLGKHKMTGKHYAIKVLQKKSIVKRNEVKHIMAERNVLLKNLRHPFLVGLHYSFQTGNKLYFVLDYVNGGELFFHLQRERCFNEARSRYVYNSNTSVYSPTLTTLSYTAGSTRPRSHQHLVIYTNRTSSTAT